ncbi:MAG: hypothetical protein KAG82_02330 [Alcanivoracaceae bacterium]|nr:hypothetical protein [Alcanivoracaceae bacterium]
MNTFASTQRIWLLALICAAIPFLTIHLSFLVSAVEGNVRWCFPYWETCTSISRTGRHGTAYFIFKGGMIPACVLLALFWWLNRLWLQLLGLEGGKSLPWLGLVSSLALLIYTLALGHAGDTFYLMRRVGVIGWFGLTYIAQLQLGASLRHHPHWGKAGQRLLQLSVVTLLIGLISVVAGLVVPERHDELENAFEWTLALLLNVHGFAVALLWRRSGFALSPQLNRRQD